MSRPRLSVVMPNYNDADFLRDSLGAILSQSRPADEVVVVDDGSTDRSLDVLGELAAAHPALRIVRNERNMGVTYTINRALGEASGEYLVTASANDRLGPGHFAACMELLEANPEAGLCFTDHASMDGQVYRFYLSEAPAYFTAAALRERCRALGYFPVSGCSAIFRRDAFMKAGGLIPALGGLSDVFVCLAICARHGAAYAPRVGMNVRRSAGSFGLRLFRWADQRRAGRHLFELLESDAYRDVFDWIRESGVWPQLQPYILFRLLSERRYWRLLTPRTLRQALWDSAAGLLTRHTPFGVKRFLSGWRDRRRAAVARAKS